MSSALLDKSKAFALSVIKVCKEIDRFFGKSIRACRFFTMLVSFSIALPKNSCTPIGMQLLFLHLAAQQLGYLLAQVPL